VGAGFIRSAGGSRLLVNPLREDLDPNPAATASWALSDRDLELL
jgi:hypothetical protein